MEKYSKHYNKGTVMILGNSLNNYYNVDSFQNDGKYRACRGFHSNCTGKPGLTSEENYLEDQFKTKSDIT